MKKIIVIALIVIVAIIIAMFFVKENLKNKITTDLNGIDFKIQDTGGIANVSLTITNNSMFPNIKVSELSAGLFSNNTFIGEAIKTEPLLLGRRTDISMTVSKINPLTITAIDFDKMYFILSFKKFGHKFSVLYDIDNTQTETETETE